RARRHAHRLLRRARPAVPTGARRKAEPARRRRPGGAVRALPATRVRDPGVGDHFVGGDVVAVSRRRPRLLCYRALGLGDLLTALPALRALRRGFPDHELVVATPPELHPLVTLAGCADALLPARGQAPPIWAGGPPYFAVNLHGSGPESHSRLRRLRPHGLAAFRCERAGWTEGPPWRRDEHEVHRWARLVEETLGLAVDRGELGLSVPFQVRPGTAVVHPGGTDPRRRWPASRFGEVAARLQAAGCDVVVTGGPHEAGLAATVVRVGRLPPTSNLAGALDVRVLTGLLASATVVVCGDTGVGHLATAVGTPSVLLFGPVSPAQWGPPPDRWRHR